MTAIVIRDTAKATGLAGLAGVRPKARDMVQRAMAGAAATILLCAVAAALAQLAAELLILPADFVARDRARSTARRAQSTQLWVPHIRGQGGGSLRFSFRPRNPVG